MTESLIQRILRISNTYADLTALLYKDQDGNYKPHSYRQLALDFMKIAYFLKHTCKVKAHEHIGIISDNRHEWVPLDFGIMSLSAVDVPRGSDTPVDEIAYILEHSDSVGCILENVVLYEKIQAYNPKILKKQRFIIFIEDIPKNTRRLPRHCYSYQKIVEDKLTQKEEEEIIRHIKDTSPDDRATIIYTSGTTSKPKGVCLTQGAFEIQIDRIMKFVLINPRQVFMSILPVWHAYAREIQYVVLGRGATIAYSKPLGKILLEDLKKVDTHFLTSVPRIWEGVYQGVHRKIKNESKVKQIIFKLAVATGTLHHRLWDILTWNNTHYKFQILPLNSLLAIIPFLLLWPLRTILDTLVFKKIRAMLGKEFVAGVSGGGALPKYVDDFFAAAKIKVLEGYGLTETAPVLSVRSLKRPQMYSIGRIFPDIKYRIFNTEKKKEDKQGELQIHVSSGQVMQGYYRNPEATQEVISADGWLNTGDIVMEARNKAIKILGRSKDTIVLSNGENIAPDRVETILLKSDFINHVMVFGQDQKAISALIVPNQEELLQYAQEHKLSQDMETLCNTPKIVEHYQAIIATFKNKLTPFEQIHKIVLIPHEFQVGEELTQTLKMKRNVIAKKYEKEMDSCYKK